MKLVNNHEWNFIIEISRSPWRESPVNVEIWLNIFEFLNLHNT